MKRDLHTLGLMACASKIAAGTLFYFFIEFAKETKVEDPNTGNMVKWSRPFFNSFLLFFGMSFTILPYYFLRHNKPGVSKVDRYTFINMIIPSLLEFVGQVMFMMGNRNVMMSLALTLKGARVAFSAMLVATFLKRKLYAFHWVGVALTLAGIVVTSIPALTQKHDDKKNGLKVLMGIGLILGGEFIRSLRTVVEEKMMKKMKYDPMLVVGLQGIYALILTIPTLFIVSNIKLSNGKPLEDITTTFEMFANTPLIIGLSCTVPLTVPGLFISGAYVTKLMSAVHNALTTILTNGIVWILTIIVYYADKSHSRGHKIDKMSAVQLLGFIMVLVASLLYDSILRIPQIFYYPLDKAAASGAGTSEKSVLGIVSSDTIPTNGDAEMVKNDIEINQQPIQLNKAVPPTTSR